MKRNAIIRIIAYSLALVVLLGILGVGLGARLYMVDSIETGTSQYQMPLISEEDTVSTVVNASEIRELEIDWAAGSISIFADEYTDKITVMEPIMTQEKYQMRCSTKGGKLSIEFQEKTIGIHTTDIPKELIIIVPADWQCEELSIDTAAASIDVQNLALLEMDVDAAAGICSFTNCTVDSLDIQTASGDVIFYGILNHLDFEAMSADCHLILDQPAITIDVESMSGDLILELPEDAGFVVMMDALSGNFSTDFETEMKNGRQWHGSGSCQISLSALSGDVAIRKHVHTEGCIGKHSSTEHHH